LKTVLFDAALLVPPSWHVYRDRVNMSDMRRAMREQRKVEISYADEQGRESKRVIWPVAISYHDAQRLVVSWCELRQDFRNFRSDRIVSATVLEERYRERRQVLLKRWVQQDKIASKTTQIDVFM
jgi:predicted DNA-binding transcriptional regulator YafY